MIPDKYNYLLGLCRVCSWCGLPFTYTYTAYRSVAICANCIKKHEAIAAKLDRENEELRSKADAMLKASAEYWEAYHKAGLRGAVVWVEATDGQLVVMTRGEYKDIIMQNIEPLQKEPYHFKDRP